LQALIAGIGVGGLIGLISVGLALIFGTMDIVNFAHGSIVMLGMYAAVVANSFLGLNPYLTALASLPVFFLFGSALYLAFIRRVRARSYSSVLILTLGISIVIDNIVLFFFGPDLRTISGADLWSLPGGVVINPVLLTGFAIAGVSAALLVLLLRVSRFGILLRAVVDDRLIARACGVNDERIMIGAMGLGTALAGFAGGVLASFYPVSPGVGVNFIVLAFAAIVLGGLGNPLFAFLGGIIIGIVQQFGAMYWSVGLQNAPVYLLLLAVLVVRPSGISGKEIAR
jgi:branched-chain amino acid transport system permease protein